MGDLSNARVGLPKRQARFAGHLIARWQTMGTITDDVAGRLNATIEITPFNWKGLASLTILTAIICFVIAIVSALADERLRKLIERLFSAPEEIKMLTFAALAAGFYTLGFRRRRMFPEKIYTNEGLLFLGVLATAASIYFFGRAVDPSSDNFSNLLLIACGVYAAIALWSESKMIWVFALLSFGGWMGAETGYVSGWGAYYLGMNYPLRFVWLGVVLIAGSFLLDQTRWRQSFFEPTLTIGLLDLFVALWIMSIFGNYGDTHVWHDAEHSELFSWSVIFGTAAAAAIWHGLKYDNSLTRGFGVTFLFLNLYTRFFEFFWDSLHKAIFFAVLGVSLWFLGSHAQRIWNLGQGQMLPDP